MTRLVPLLTLAAALCFGAVAATAGPVGERHLATTDASAAARSADHSSQVRVSVWYPAARGAVEQRLDFGPPGHPLLVVGAAAPDAPFADRTRRPVILFSHGYGGTARIMAWFTTALARAGYVVIAVDHPGNNGVDKMTVAAVVLPWERAQDLAAALAAAEADPVIGSHLDPRRVGVAGFSAGGFTALVGVGAHVDMAHFLAFCRAHPTDGDCAPQKELAVSLDQAQTALRSPAVAPLAVRAGDDHAIPGARAAFAMAPAMVQALPAPGLARIKAPVAIILGADDPIATPSSNGLLAARVIPHAELKVLAGVGHYDFLASCTPAGRAGVPYCTAKVPQGPTHAAAIAMALAFFDRTLGAP